jgi:nucleoside-diphosphate-sugar epimerase
MNSVAPSKVIGVTGGSGFLGSHLLRRLVQEGAQVRAMTRRQVSQLPESIRHSAVEWVRGDVTDQEAVARTFAGTSLVFHLAGCAKPWTRDANEPDRVNAAGTATVCEACRAAGVERMVHTSTNLVEIGNPENDGRYLRTAYQRSKLAAEDAVRAAAERGLSAVVVRPTRVYGPGPINEANTTTRLIDLYRRGLFRMRLADGGARANYVYVEDVVDGLILAARHGTSGAAYTLGGQDATLPELLGQVAALTAPRRVVAVPLPAARRIADALGLLALVGVRPPITREWVDLLALDWPSSSEPAERELGYRPRSLADGIRLTLRWLEAGRPQW